MARPWTSCSRSFRPGAGRTWPPSDRSFGLTPGQLRMTGIHPEFGLVTLEEMLATWVAHDLDHLMQIARVMARRYTENVGPWRRYLRVIGEPIEPYR